MRVIFAALFSAVVLFMLGYAVLYYAPELETFANKSTVIFVTVMFCIGFLTSVTIFRITGLFELPSEDRHERCPRLKNRVCTYPHCSCSFYNLNRDETTKR